MKKLLLTLLTIFMLVPIVGTFESTSVKALGQNEMACGAFEVDYIEDDGSFTSKGCYDDLASAKQAMKSLGGDHVVRHAKSLSYTKIVAMNSGVAYSYNRNKSTLNIYQDVAQEGYYYKYTYVGRHYELNYVDTERCLVGQSGYAYGMIEVNVMGFHGYCDLENVDLVPSKFLRNGIAITLGGSNGGPISYGGEYPFTLVCTQNYYEVVKTGNYRELIYHIYRGYSTTGTAESSTIAIGVASDQMKEGVKYYSNDGYTFYTSDTFTGDAIVYYNYYQFLPLRSKTNISADTFNSFISQYSGSVMANSGQSFIDAQNTYGINALLLFAMACHESSYGRSGYAKNRNNLFGWNAVDADPDQASYFASVAACVSEQAGINLRGYVDITDGRFFSSSLGNKGSGLNVKYASDPYWGMEIASIAYAIDKYANNKNGNLSDLNKYELYLINTFDINVYSSVGGSVLYTTQYGPYYQENFIVISLGDAGNGYTKIQSTNPIDDNGNIKTHRTPITTGELNPISYGEYNYDKSVGYVESKYLTKLSSVTTSGSTVTPSSLSVVASVDTLTMNNSTINIQGDALIKGMNNTSNMSHVVTLYNISDGSVYKTYTATTSQDTGIGFNDGYTYSNVYYNVNIPLSDIGTGSYYIGIIVNNGSVSMSKNLVSTFNSHSNMNASLNNLSYRITTNSMYSYRIELDVDSLPSAISYTSINKPNKRTSMFAFDVLTLDSNLNMYISGQALIYYVNFDNQSNIKYTIYALRDSDTYKTINASTLRSDWDYKSLLNSSYNMDYICYEANSNLSDLKDGYYEFIMKIENGDKVDYVEMRNLSNSTKIPDQITYNGKIYRFFTSTIRDRLMLEISSVSEEPNAE